MRVAICSICPRQKQFLPVFASLKGKNYTHRKILLGFSLLNTTFTQGYHKCIQAMFMSANVWGIMKGPCPKLKRMCVHENHLQRGNKLTGSESELQIWGS